LDPGTRIAHPVLLPGHRQSAMEAAAGELSLGNASPGTAKACTPPRDGTAAADRSPQRLRRASASTTSHACAWTPPMPRDRLRPDHEREQTRDRAAPPSLAMLR